MKKLISMLFMAVLAVLTMTGCDDEETVLQKYTVTFNSQGGSEVASQAVYAGEKIVKPANPTKEKEYFVEKKQNVLTYGILKMRLFHKTLLSMLNGQVLRTPLHLKQTEEVQ